MHGYTEMFLVKNNITWNIGAYYRKKDVIGWNTAVPINGDLFPMRWRRF